MSARNVVSMKATWVTVSRVMNFVVRFLKEWERQGLDLYDFFELCTGDFIKQAISAVRLSLGVKELYRDPEGLFCVIKVSGMCEEMSPKQVIEKLERRGYYLPSFRDYDDLNHLMLLGEQSLSGATKCHVIFPVRGGRGISYYGMALEPIVRHRKYGPNYTMVNCDSWECFPANVFKNPWVVALTNPES